MYAELTGDSKKQRIKSLCGNKMYLEYGTRFMDAQPFVRPAYNEQKAKFIRDMNKLTR
jgi:HK97 gp10 family phage protein